MSRDWSGEWFRFYEELGEDTNMNCLLGVDGKEHYLNSNHRRYDGYSGTHWVFRELGLKDEDLKPPNLKRKRFNLFVLLKNIFNKSKKQKIIFKDQLEKNYKPGLDIQVWSKVSTAYLEELLYSVDRVFKREFNNLESNLWMVPVNMRFGSEKKYEGNKSSFVEFEIESDDSPTSVKNKLMGALKFQQQHIVNWWMLNIGILIGLRGMKFLFDKLANKKKRIGVFSHLGDWEFKGKEKIDPYVFWGPTSEKTPFFVVVTVLNKQAYLSIAAHASQRLSKEALNSILTKIVVDAETTS